MLCPFEFSQQPSLTRQLFIVPITQVKRLRLESFNNLPNIPQLVSGEHGMRTVFGSEP